MSRSKRPADAAPEEAETSHPSVSLKLRPGERQCLVGFARARVTRGALWVHGHRVASGCEATLCSSPEAGSLLALECAPGCGGVEAVLTALERPSDCPKAAQHCS